MSRMRILIVDDEPTNVALLEDMLREAGHGRVKAITDSRLALETCAAFDPDLVLLDLMMPLMNGEETYRRLRLIRPDVKVILSSGYNDIEALSRFSGKDLAGFLKKPFTAAELGEVIKQAFGEQSGASR